jgi:nicotinamidase-related amidase
MRCNIAEPLNRPKLCPSNTTCSGSNTLAGYPFADWHAMTTLNADLHGNVPDKSPLVLLIIDMINDLDFPEGESLLAHAFPMSERLQSLKKRCKSAGIPAVYVNDNFGRWRSDFRAQVQHCLRDKSLGRPIAERLRPEEDDYFVLKPKHSGFYSTTLDVLLRYLGAKTLIITGIAGDNCVLFTASDAFLRDYRLLVPADCVASNTEADNERALAQMQATIKADIVPSAAIDFKLHGEGPLRSRP